MRLRHPVMKIMVKSIKTKIQSKMAEQNDVLEG